MGRKYKSVKEITPEMREQVRVLKGLGTPHKAIAYMLKISEDSMSRHCGEELSVASDVANAGVAKGLYQKAISGDTTAMIFWLKTRAGWRESVNLQHTDGEGRPLKAVENNIIPLDLSKLTPEQLDRFIENTRGA